MEDDLAPGISVSLAIANPAEGLTGEPSRYNIRTHVLAPPCPLLDRVAFCRTGVVAAVRRVVGVDGGAVNVTCPGSGGPKGLGRNGEPSNATRQVGVRPGRPLPTWVSVVQANPEGAIRMGTAAAWEPGWPT